MPVNASIVPLPDLRVPAIRVARAAVTRAIAAPSLVALEAEPLAYETVDWRPAETGRLTEALYEAYGLQSIRISGSQAHPTPLVQSAAMASVAPPTHLPPGFVVTAALSDAQLETVIYAGEAHAGYLAGGWIVDETFDSIAAAPDDSERAVRFA